jgi:dolichol-phosphate mannosyltransferase
LIQISDERLDILLLIPCYNEEENIENILEHLRGVTKNLEKRKELNLEILIINDGSSDRTEHILEKNKENFLFRVINFKENQGYGHTLITGFNYAKKMKFSWIISFDMDGQHEPKCLYDFIDIILKNPKEKIISGTRYKNGDLFWQNPWKDRFLVNTIITGILNTLGLSITDAFCGLKAYDCEAINDLDLEIKGYEMPIEVWIKSLKKGYSIVEKEVPVIYKDRNEVVKNSKESFLFRKGDERIEKYIQIIESLMGTPLKTNINVFESIFSKYFKSLDDINKDNFRKIQESIFKQIKELEA